MDIKNWIDNVKRSVLNPLFYSYLGRDSKYHLSIGIGELSYCSSESWSILVSLTKEETEELNVSDLLRILKFKMYHECSHALYTHDGLYEVCENSMTNIWKKEASKRGLMMYDDQILDYANSILNSLEDGRIENIMCNQKRGLVKHRNWYRIREWEKNPIFPSWGDLSNTLNGILDISTMGIYPKDFTKYYNGENRVYKTVTKAIPDIGNFVKSNGLTEAKKYSDNVARIIADIVVSELAVTKEEYNNGKRKLNDMINNLKNQMEGQSNNFKAEKADSNSKNGPIIGIITDEDNNKSDDGINPDIIIDLRKNPPKETEEKSSKGKKNNGKNTKSDKKSEENKKGSSGGDAKGNDSGSSGSSANDSSNGSSNENTTEQTTGNDKGGGVGRSGVSRSKRQDSNTEDNSSNTGKISGGTKDELAEGLSNILKDIEKQTENTLKKDLEKANKDGEIERKKTDNSETKLSAEELKNLGVLEQDFDEISSFNSGRGYDTSPERMIKLRAGRTTRKLKNIIASKSVTERNELYDGLIDTDALGRFVTGKSDIFKAPARKTEPDMCCYILKDNSGSMRGYNKENMAIEAAAEIEETFKPLVPLKITAFNSIRGKVTHKVIKDWKDTDNKKSYSFSYKNAGNMPDGSNDDAMSIRIVTEELLKRPEKHRVLVVISDGLPAECTEEDVLKTVKYARSKGIFLMSFFIGSDEDRKNYYDNYKYMYEKYFACVDPMDLGNKIVVIMKEIFKKL